MSTIASQITSLTIVYSTIYSGADQSKHQSSASLAFVWGIHRGPVNSPHKWPVTRKMFPFDDVIMVTILMWRPTQGGVTKDSFVNFTVRNISLLQNYICLFVFPSHDDVMKWKHSCYGPFVRGIHRSPVNSLQKSVTRSFDVLFDLHLNKRWSKQ